MSLCADMTQLCLATILGHSYTCKVMKAVGQLAMTAAAEAYLMQQSVHNLMTRLCKQLYQLLITLQWS